MSPPSKPLSVREIRQMIDRLREAHIPASINDDPKWSIIARAIHELQELHKMHTGRQY